MATGHLNRVLLFSGEQLGIHQTEFAPNRGGFIATPAVRTVIRIDETDTAGIPLRIVTNLYPIQFKGPVGRVQTILVRPGPIRNEDKSQRYIFAGIIKWNQGCKLDITL